MPLIQQMYGGKTSKCLKSMALVRVERTQEVAVGNRKSLFRHIARLKSSSYLVKRAITQ